MRKSIIGHEHHPIRCLLASRMEFPVRTRIMAATRDRQKQGLGIIRTDRRHGGLAGTGNVEMWHKPGLPMRNKKPPE
jgi:hypothetical protein